MNNTWINIFVKRRLKYLIFNFNKSYLFFQISNQLFAEYIWRDLEKFLPHYIGDVNPNNQRIVDIFGDQGGH